MPWRQSDSAQLLGRHPLLRRAGGREGQPGTRKVCGPWFLYGNSTTTRQRGTRRGLGQTPNSAMIWRRRPGPIAGRRTRAIRPSPREHGQGTAIVHRRNQPTASVATRGWTGGSAGEWLPNFEHQPGLSILGSRRRPRKLHSRQRPPGSYTLHASWLDHGVYVGQSNAVVVTLAAQPTWHGDLDPDARANVWEIGIPPRARGILPRRSGVALRDRLTFQQGTSPTGSTTPSDQHTRKGLELPAAAEPGT